MGNFFSGLSVSPRISTFSLGLLTLTVTFTLQSCSQNYGLSVAANARQASSNSPGATVPGGIGTGSGPSSLPFVPAGPATLPPPIAQAGLKNGHFDVDTATGSMPFDGGNSLGLGTVTSHVHQYDKVNRTTTVDFFNLINNGNVDVAGTNLDNIQDVIPRGQGFYVVVVNSKLNPGTVLSLNGKAIYATDYQAAMQAKLDSSSKPVVYSFGNVSGSQLLRSLSVGFDPTVNANSLLIPTSPLDCVFPNIAGPYGEYRDGALVIQAVSASSFAQDPSTGAAAPGSGLLWEGIVYNHYMLEDSEGKEQDSRYCYGSIINGSLFY